MLALSDFRALQHRKRQSLTGIVVSSTVLIAALVGRFVPPLKDALSGPPRYMEVFSDLMARQIANTTRNEYPVLVSRAENADCRSVNEGHTSDDDDAYYVLTFSEQSRSVCLTVYGALPQDSKAAGITLTLGSARNYGREFKTRVRAVPLHRSLTVLSPEYLSLLHWRVKVDPKANVKAGAAQRITSPSAQISFADASLNFQDIRAEVAKRHTFVNQVLVAVVFASGVFILLLLWRLRRLYGESDRLCRSLGPELPIRIFLMRDLFLVGQETESEYQQKRQESLAHARLEHIIQREREEATRRLHGVLDSTQEESTRLRIQAALGSGSLDDMQAVLDELQPQVSQKTPEERLRLLLESLKDYASENEVREVETEALSALRGQGFRQAREVVIHFHEQFRARCRQLLEEGVRSTESAANSSGNTDR